MSRWLPVLVLFIGVAFAQNDSLKVAFIYVGPVGDYGFSYAHDLGRQALEEAVPEVETVYVESVPEAEVEPFIDQLVADGADVVIATSFGYGDGVLAAARRYPDVIFGHATGVKRAPNVMTFMADIYQVYYLNGLIAGALSDSDRIGYVGAFPIPEVKRHINAFAIGAKEANPEAVVEVRWLYSWFDPAGAKEATEALMAEGADVFGFTEDTPTVIQTAAEEGYPSFSHYASMLEFSPDTVASGQLVHWETILIDFIEGVLAGEYTTGNLQDLDYFWLLAEGAVELGAEPGMPINPVYEEELRAYTIEHPEFGQISAWDLVFERLEQMSSSPVEFDPFQGPTLDRNGNVVYEEGEMPTVPELLSIQWAAENVVGPWEGEP
ncbi:MAG TPA: BMP family ABC transporter substrate-binding protein [Trueperaceae bacterium]